MIGHYNALGPRCSVRWHGLWWRCARQGWPGMHRGRHRWLLWWWRS